MSRKNRNYADTNENVKMRSMDERRKVIVQISHHFLYFSRSFPYTNSSYIFSASHMACSGIKIMDIIFPHPPISSITSFSKLYIRSNVILCISIFCYNGSGPPQSISFSALSSFQLSSRLELLLPRTELSCILTFCNWSLLPQLIDSLILIHFLHSLIIT